MYAGAARHTALGASAITTLLVSEYARDTAGVVLPRAEVHLSVRFGTSTRNGVDVHAIGAFETVRRKHLHSGQRIVLARLQLGAVEAVLGVPASALAGRIVPLEDLWGAATTGRLVDRLAAARGTSPAAKLLESAIAERSALAAGQRARTQLVLAAADRLASANVAAVALDLGVSERHLRRVFRETTGMSPKTFAQLTRFQRAVRAARAAHHESWTTIAASAGYYDQAHLIAEFRAIAGVTPRALLGELRAAHSFG